MLQRVVFPAPFSPSSAWIRHVALRTRRGRLATTPPAKRLVTPDAATAGAAPAVAELALWGHSGGSEVPRSLLGGVKPCQGPVPGQPFGLPITPCTKKLIEYLLSPVGV